MMYVRNLLISLDLFLNTFLSPILNMILRPTVARFGDPDETLSSVFSKNIKNGSCRGCRMICRLLHIVDPKHCEKSIEHDEGRNA